MPLAMAMVACQCPSNSSYVSACSSSNISFSSSVYFYSLPSPAYKQKSVAKSDNELLEITAETEVVSDDEFKTGKFRSQLSGHQQQEQNEQNEQLLPAILFADEAFCNGQVLPLKAPPRLQHVEHSKSGNLSNTSIPRSPGSVMKGPCSCWGARKEDVRKEYSDPFMAAFELVRKERRDLGSPSRTGSLSPRRTTPDCSNTTRRVTQYQDREFHPIKPIQILISTPRRLKGLMRSASATETGQKRPSDGPVIKPTHTTVPGPTATTTEGHWRYRKKKIKDFLFRSAFVGRSGSKGKLRAALRKPLYWKRINFKYIQAAHSNGKKMRSKKTHHMPKLCLCFGLNIKKY